MKIAHISDLHFCIPELKIKLENLQQRIAEKFGFYLDIEFSDNEKQEDLINFLEKEKPNALVISGDITSFGDAASYEEASTWIKY